MAYQNKQQQQEWIKYLLAKQQQLENERKNKPNYLQQANNLRSQMGNYGYSLSKSNNPAISNIGNKIYNFSGQNALNALKGNASNAIKTGIQNIGSKLVPKAVGAVGNSALGASTESGALAGTTAGTAGSTLGATAASTGAGTATAAGTAAGASSAIPIAGPIIAATLIGAQLLKSHGDKKRNKAMQESAKIMEENMQNAADKKMQAMQNIQNNTAQNFDFPSNNDNTENNGIVDNLLSKWKDGQNFNNGYMTGGAAPIADDRITLYQDFLRQNGYADNVVNGVTQGLNNGYPEVDDWIKQYNEGAGLNNPIRIPQTQEEIELARKGEFNTPTQVAEISENGKKSWLNNLANGLSDFSKGYIENKDNSFAIKNLMPDSNKNNMTRVGEAFGTASRISQNPILSTALAAYLTKQFGGTSGQTALNAYKYGTERQKGNIYNKLLKDYGIDVPNGFFSNIDNNDVNAILTPKYKEQEMKLNELYKNALIQNMLEKTKIQQQNADTQSYRAKNATTVKYIKSGGGKSDNNTQPPKQIQKQNEGYVLMKSPDGRIFKCPESRIKKYKKAGGKIVG